MDERLATLAESMERERQGIEKYRARGEIEKARDVHTCLQNARCGLLNEIAGAGLFLSEAALENEAAYAAKLYESVKAFNLMTADYTKFVGAVKALAEKIPETGESESADESENGKANAAVIGRLMANVKMGYYPTDLDHVALMRKALVFPGAKVNLLDPCCGCGLALQRVAQGQNAATYGAELDEARAEEAQTRLDRVGLGSFFHSQISHDAFHALFLNPPYLSVTNEKGKARHEKRFLVDSLCHLTGGGVLMYVVPHYRLTPDICRVLCDNFEDITVWRFLGKEFGRFKQVAVFGRKIKRSDGSDGVPGLLRLAMNPAAIPTLDQIGEGRYALPDKEKKVEIFKGAEFNVHELARQLKNSKSIGKLFERSKLDAMKRRPLLPLNIGQIGLVGGSGLINGLIECDAPHVLKGRIVKKVKRIENKDASEVTETRVNQMVFNILTPEGYKSLAS
jgi:methylase of polypeptide subunit release factors